MLKFKSKKKETQISQQKPIKKDSWVKSHFIVVPNTTTPNDLTDYQKLIVLRKPEGEQRVIVDFSLTDAETNMLHNESLENDVVNIDDKNLLRIIPTDLNTKEKESYDNLSDEEIEKMSAILRANSEEFKEFDKTEEKEEYESILRLDDKNVRIVDDSYYKPVNDFDSGFEDIDSIVIPTDEQKELRETWKDVDQYILEEEEIEKRKQNKYVMDPTKPYDYVPGPQPLFRNFIDTDFFDISKYNLDKDTLEKPLIGGYPKYDENESEFFGTDTNVEEYSIAQLPKVPTYSELDEPIDINDESQIVNEDPEIVISSQQMDKEDKKQIQKQMNDYVNESVSVVATNKVEPEVIEQPTVLSFFKNKVSAPSTHTGSVQHSNKYIKFYNTNDERKYKYEKVILNRKMKMYTYRKVLVK